MVCRIAFVLEHQHLPGGSGSNDSLIPTIRAPAGLRASEQNGSGWLPSSFRKKSLCVQSSSKAGCSCPWLAPALGQGRSGLPPLQTSPSSSQPSALGLSALDPTSLAGDVNEEGARDEERRDTGKENRRKEDSRAAHNLSHRGDLFLSPCQLPSVHEVL